MTKQDKRKIGMLFIVVILGLVFLHSKVRMINTQNIRIAAAVDTENGAINQSRKFILLDRLEIGKQYEITVQYVVTKKITSGRTLFLKKYQSSIKSTDNVAQFGCSPIEVKSVFYATKKHVAVNLGLIATPSNIHTDDGNYFNNSTHQLIPVIMVRALE